MQHLPATGYVRLIHIIGDANAHPPVPAVIPVSKSTWWAGVKSGRYPQPVRTLGLRITAWRVEDILALIERAAASSSAAEHPFSGTPAAGHSEARTAGGVHRTGSHTTR